MSQARVQVLVIEDDPQIRRFLAAALDAHGYDSEFAATGADGLRLATARLLCGTGQDLNQIGGWTAAVGQVRAGEEFARGVFQAADSYGQRTKNVE